MAQTASAEFVDAAACGDLSGVQALLETTDPALPAACINCVDKDGRSAFHYACLNDDVPLLSLLLADARVDASLRSPKGDTGLHMAALYAALEAMALLRTDGRIALDGTNQFGETPLHLCAGSGDKGAGKAAALLLQWGAPLHATDKWLRGPLDVSRDNGENPLLAVFEAHLALPEHAVQKAQAAAVTAAYRASTAEHLQSQKSDSATASNKAAAFSIFGQLGGVTLKKTKTVERSMFKKSEGSSSTSNSKSGGSSSSSSSSSDSSSSSSRGDGRRALSKLLDFPGDVEEVRRHLASPSEVDPAGRDAYGLTALHKLASWNKTMLMEMLIPALPAGAAGLDATCPDGKTALHWAVEMAAVASVKLLLQAGADRDAKDGKGRTVAFILDHSGESGVIERLKAALLTEPNAEPSAQPPC